MELNSIASVQGIFENYPVYSHTVLDEHFYKATLLVNRLSGTVDKLPVTIPGKLLAVSEIQCERMMVVTGQVRSYNKSIEGAGRLIITIFAQAFEEAQDHNNLNHITLNGVLCKSPVYRTTPFGREICDMMLAVNRAFSKSDYIPCIAWGRNAKFAGSFSVGDALNITGRLQSRDYQKLLESGEYVTRTAYEVSAMTLEKYA